MSPFDPNTFMEQTVDAELATRMEQCPQGEYQAMVDDFDTSAFSTFTSDKNGKTYTTFKVPFSIQDAAVKAELDREKVVVSQNIFLDLNESGGLDTGKGKNIGLGKLREALGQNTAGAWSFNNLKGAGPVMVKVGWRANPKDPTIQYAEVTSVAPIR